MRARTHTLTHLIKFGCDSFVMFLLFFLLTPLCCSWVFVLPGPNTQLPSLVYLKFIVVVADFIPFLFL